MLADKLIEICMCQRLKNGSMSQKHAAEKYGIPRSTLGDKTTFPGAHESTSPMLKKQSYADF